MCHTKMSYVPHKNVLCAKKMSYVPHKNVLCATQKCPMCHTKMSYVPHKMAYAPKMTRTQMQTQWMGILAFDSQLRLHVNVDYSCIRHNAVASKQIKYTCKISRQNAFDHKARLTLALYCWHPFSLLRKWYWTWIWTWISDQIWSKSE